MNTRISRRRLLAVSGAASAATAASIAFACRDGKKKPAPTAATASPTAGATNAPLVTAVTRGGVLRVYNFDAQPPETLDPHLARGGPIGNMHSAVFSKLLRYDDERAGSIVPDLAESMPEQPDDLTYIFRLREDVSFHDAPKFRDAFPSTAGRALTSEDVRYSIERQTAQNRTQTSRFQRRSQFAVIDRIDTPNDRTIVLKLKTPTAPFLSFIAGRHTLVIPREVVDLALSEANRDVAMIGSGPFMLESFEPGVAVKLRRNPAWFARDDGGASGRPYLARSDAFFSPQQDAFQREAFDGGYVDSTGFLDPGEFERARTTNLADIAIDEGDSGGLLASRFLIDRPPFNDDRVRRAIHLAIDRAELAEAMYPPMAGRPSARLAGPIAPALDRWALPEPDLLRRPGYGELRASEITGAKQLWAAALGETPITELRMLVAGTPRTIAEIGVPMLQRQLNETLGVNIVPQIDPSGDALIAAGLRLNIEGAAEGAVPFTFGLEDSGVDLDDCVYGQFRSGEPGNTFRLQDATLDALLDKQRTEFGAEGRRQLGLDIQEYLLANANARIEYLAPVNRRLTWGYVRNSPLPLWYGSNFSLADTWLDTTHPAWPGRKP